MGQRDHGGGGYVAEDGGGPGDKTRLWCWRWGGGTIGVGMGRWDEGGGC